MEESLVRYSKLSIITATKRFNICREEATMQLEKEEEERRRREKKAKRGAGRLPLAGRVVSTRSSQPQRINATTWPWEPCCHPLLPCKLCSAWWVCHGFGLRAIWPCSHHWRCPPHSPTASAPLLVPSSPYASTDQLMGCSGCFTNWAMPTLSAL